MTCSIKRRIRASIIQYTCQLMKLDNVSIVGSFAKIEGKLNIHRVQLGSGSIYQGGSGNIYGAGLQWKTRQSILAIFR